MKIIERIVDLETGETTDVERTLTKAEVDAIEAKKEEVAAKAQEATTKAAEKAALLAQLGITEDQAKLLLS
jgi:hypothetical protein